MIMLPAKIKEIQNKNCYYIKRLPHSFLFPEGQIHQDQSFYFHFLCYTFVETIFEMKLNRLVTKYTDTLTFNFAHSINPKWCIMPL